MKLILDLGDLGERECYVEYDYHPSTTDVMYYSNGDPGEPGEPEYVEITKLFVIDFNIAIPVKHLTESACRYIEYKISKYERKRA